MSSREIESIPGSVDFNLLFRDDYGRRQDLTARVLEDGRVEVAAWLYVDASKGYVSTPVVLGGDPKTTFEKVLDQSGIERAQVAAEALRSGTYTDITSQLVARGSNPILHGIIRHRVENINKKSHLLLLGHQSTINPTRTTINPPLDLGI